MDGRGRAARYWAVLVIVSAAVAVALVMAYRLTGRLDRAEADRDALRAQVLRMGGTPVAGPTGADGAAGPTGAAGRDGEDGTDGRDGKSGAPGEPGSPGPTGAAGTPGSPGSAGAPGVPGPAGPTGPIGPSGSPGPQGEQGDKGDTGEPGESVMCADGYHPEDIVIAPYEGTWQVCKKDDD